MAAIISYRYNIWSPGEECSVVEYTTGPPAGQRYLEGEDKEEALALIQEDIDAVASGAPHSSSTINEGQRWYWWTIQPSRRSSWEVRLDENGDQVPYPCEPIPIPPADPRNRKFSFTNGTGRLVYRGQNATLTLRWTELPPEATLRD